MNCARFSGFWFGLILLLPMSLQQAIAFPMLELTRLPTHGRGLRDLQERALGVHSSPGFEARPFGPSFGCSRPGDFARPSELVK